jgi:hypothetical protein
MRSKIGTYLIPASRKELRSFGEQAKARLRRDSATARTFMKRMSSPRNQISWLIDFALRPDFKKLDESTRSRLALEVYDFCLALGGRPVFEIAMSRKDLSRLASEARYLLDAPGHGPRGIDLKLKFTLYVDRDPKNRLLRASYLGEFVPLWPLFVSRLIEKHGNLVRACQFKECGKPFLAKKRRLYCSETCAQRDRTRRHREKKGSAYVRAARVRYYVQERLKKDENDDRIRDYLIARKQNEPEEVTRRLTKLFKKFGIAGEKKSGRDF